MSVAQASPGATALRWPVRMTASGIATAAAMISSAIKSNRHQCRRFTAGGGLGGALSGKGELRLAAMSLIAILHSYHGGPCLVRRKRAEPYNRHRGARVSRSRALWCGL